jgi:hypothetical protein
LKIGATLAAKNSTAGKSIFIDCTFAAVVIWTPAGYHRLYFLGTKICSQIYQFRCGNKQAVVKMSEIATSPANVALAG